MTIHTTVASLAKLAATIDADLGLVDQLPIGTPASLIRVLRNGEVAIRDLDDEMHPVDALLGFVAPDDWQIFGVIASGWATVGNAASGEPVRKRVRVIHIASRDGDETSVIRFAGDASGQPVPNQDPVGRVPDCLRRAFDLPTPTESDGALLALWWDRVLQVLTARNHPSFEGRLITLDEISGLIESAQPTSWEDERWAVVQAGGNALMDGAIAAWMDAGMFGRWLLSELVDPDIAIPTAKRACTDQAWTMLLTTFADHALRVELEWCG